MKKIERILAAVDLSPSSLEGLHWAACLAKGLDADLTILSVMDQNLRDDFDHLGAGWKDKKRIEDKLLQAAQMESVNMKRTRLCVRTGIAVEEILAVARHNHADLIVMGTSGRQGITRILLGSVAEAVLRRSSCPVLVHRENTGYDRRGRRSVNAGVMAMAAEG